jgi:hypothetical protein
LPGWSKRLRWPLKRILESGGMRWPLRATRLARGASCATVRATVNSIDSWRCVTAAKERLDSGAQSDGKPTTGSPQVA